MSVGSNQRTRALRVIRNHDTIPQNDAVFSPYAPLFRLRPADLIILMAYAVGFKRLCGIIDANRENRAGLRFGFWLAFRQVQTHGVFMSAWAVAVGIRRTKRADNHRFTLLVSVPTNRIVLVAFAYAVELVVGIRWALQVASLLSFFQGCSLHGRVVPFFWNGGGALRSRTVAAMMTAVY